MTFEQMLVKIRKECDESGEKIQIKPTKVLYRPEDIERIAKIRGVSTEQVWADIWRIE